MSGNLGSGLGGFGIVFSNVTSTGVMPGGGFLTPATSEYYGGVVSTVPGQIYLAATAEEIAAHRAAEAAALAQAQAQQAFLSVPSGLVPNFLKADPKQPDTLGWREWTWNAENECLQSPSQGTLWPTERHKADKWNKDDAVRGVAGIHALLVPRHWKILGDFGAYPLYGSTITGIVERFGKYVLGTEGWRAEQVVIKELLAPTTEIGLKLEQKYPNVIVHYPDQNEEGDASCTSEKSSGSVKGNRPLSPSPNLSAIVSLLSSQLSQPSPISSQVLPLPSPSGSPRRFQPERLMRAWPILLLCWCGLMLVRLLV